MLDTQQRHGDTIIGTFHCDGDESSGCHQYPNCGCEAWLCDHDRMPQAKWSYVTPDPSLDEAAELRAGIIDFEANSTTVTISGTLVAENGIPIHRRDESKTKKVGDRSCCPSSRSTSCWLDDMS